jgi:hypothetical protein
VQRDTSTCELKWLTLSRNGGILHLSRLRAHQSGGLVLTSAKDIAGQIARCAADLESYYSLAFEYPPASQFGEYHSLEVKIDKPDIAVRTRKLYYAEQ